MKKLKLKEVKIKSKFKYLRYIKICIKKQAIVTIVITSVISNAIILSQKIDYENKYKDVNEIELEVLVIGNKEEKEYTNIYETVVKSPEKYKGTKIYISIDKKAEDVYYADILKIYGEFIEPSIQRNYMGFSYKEYLKTKGIYGTVNINRYEIISRKNINQILMNINTIGIKIKKNINQIMSEEAASIVIALILGDTSNIDEEIKDNFKNANLTHILAISGMHITCIIEGITSCTKKTMGKKAGKKYIIMFLVLYAFLVKDSPAILRAVIMGIMSLLAVILKRKNDFWTSLGLSALIILILNPYSILNLGFQLTYLGTIGIVLFQKNIKYLIKKYIQREDRIRVKNTKDKKSSSEINIISDISVSLSAQIMILPMLIYTNNIFAPYFLISSILISFVITYTIYLSFLTSILSLINLSIAKIFTIPLEILIQSILTISQISKLPFSKIYITTPKLYTVILIYILIIILNMLITIFRKKRTNFESTRETENKVYNLVHLFRYRIKEKRKRWKRIPKIYPQNINL